MCRLNVDGGQGKVRAEGWFRRTDGRVNSPALGRAVVRRSEAPEQPAGEEDVGGGQGVPGGRDEEVGPALQG